MTKTGTGVNAAGGVGSAARVQAQREWRVHAIARVDESKSERVETLARRALYHWPRWHAPPPSDPAELIATFEAEQAVGASSEKARNEATADGGGRHRRQVAKRVQSRALHGDAARPAVA